MITTPWQPSCRKYIAFRKQPSALSPMFDKSMVMELFFFCLFFSWQNLANLSKLWMMRGLRIQNELFTVALQTFIRFDSKKDDTQFKSSEFEIPVAWILKRFLPCLRQIKISFRKVFPPSFESCSSSRKWWKLICRWYCSHPALKGFFKITSWSHLKGALPVDLGQMLFVQIRKFPRVFDYFFFQS